MKNRFFLLTLGLFLSTLTINGSENNIFASNKKQPTIVSAVSYPFRKIWEHKKKFAALTVITGYALGVYLTNQEFKSLYEDYKEYLSMTNKDSYPKDIETITDRLATLATGWFSIKYQRILVRNAITDNLLLFPGWKVIDQMGSNAFSILRQIV